jgi:hypothetical protein
MFSMVSFIGSGFENSYPEIGDPGAPQPADQLFCFSGKHGTTDYFNPSAAFKLHGWFNKHPAEFRFG